MLHLSSEIGRKLAVSVQQLTAPQLPPTHAGMLKLFRALGCVQIDPIRAVERTQYLVLWSRLGAYPRTLLSDLQCDQRLLREYWAHAASIVLTENYPIHAHQMAQYREGRTNAGARAQAWLQANETFRAYVLEEIGRKGMVSSDELEDRAVVAKRPSDGWTNGRNVGRLLDILWFNGEIVVAQRKGIRRYWGLSADYYPLSTTDQLLSEREAMRQAVQISLKALGVATQREISWHFIRGEYLQLRSVLAELQAEKIIVPCRVPSWGDDPRWIHADCLPLLAQLEAGDWQPRTVLLSPFDNLICDRRRTREMWGFDFTIEIYVPAAKRRYGYYVLPILHGEQLIGRISPRMDYKTGVLTIENIYAEPETADSAETSQAINKTIVELATWLGASTIQLQSNQTPWHISF